MIWLLPTVLLTALLWFSVKYPWWRPAIDLQLPRILMYHMVREHIPGARFNGLRVKPAEFDKQLHWLNKNGWQFWFLSELLAATEVPEKVVVITFDDGFEDNYCNALPILRKYNAQATLFLVEDRFDNDWSVKKKAHHSSGELLQEPKLSDQQVREMVSSGYVELGGHSVTHADFSKLGTEQKRHELAHSKTVLQEKYGQQITSYAYTFGIYDSEDISLVQQLGYRGAVTTQEGINDNVQAQRFELKRVKVPGKKDYLYFRLSMRVGPGALAG